MFHNLLNTINKMIDINCYERISPFNLFIELYNFSPLSSHQSVFKVIISPWILVNNSENFQLFQNLDIRVMVSLSCSSPSNLGCYLGMVCVPNNYVQSLSMPFYIKGASSVKCQLKRFACFKLRCIIITLIIMYYPL